MTDNHLIFVYGTLKRGGSNRHYMAGQKFIGQARTVPGYRLFSMGSYPGMVPYPVDRNGVVGEIWSADSACIARLDILEGIANGIYRREPARLLPPFADQKIEWYIFGGSVAGRRDLGSEFKV